jgi:hypothetical protein
MWVLTFICCSVHEKYDEYRKSIDEDEFDEEEVDEDEIDGDQRVSLPILKGYMPQSSRCLGLLYSYYNISYLVRPVYDL